MRNAGRLKLGYYPLPPQECRRLRSLVSCGETFSVIDPCVGTGLALHLITESCDCRRYGIELDAERASAALRSGVETVQGNVFDAHAKVESFSMLYLNPLTTRKSGHSTISGWNCCLGPSMARR